MDQREWDYGARMSRERRAADASTSRNPDSPDFAAPDPKWDSLTDTGSLRPSAEALDWQRRADQWAQQAESDDRQSVEPANRWSDAAATGRPTFPADGVGWRTETAEWRATGARFRQTTEWRSTTGSHVWRSTTEAWQSGDGGAYPPAAETPMSQPAIASTAWSEETSSDSRPAWQQFADPSTESGADRQTTSPSWQQPSPRTPAESSPSWQQLVEPAQPQSWESRPSWQRDAIEGSATWTDLTDQRSAPEPAPADSGTTWLRTEDPLDDGRHLVREDDRAAWRRESGGGSPPVGRRRAPEPGSAPSGGTGWSGARSDGENWENTDNWARHTDTGGIQLYDDTPAPPATSWGTGTGFGSRNVNRRDDGRRQLPSAYGDSPGYEVPPTAPYEPPPRPPRRDDTAGVRALPPGSYDETPRQRYAPDDEQSRYADEAPGGGRRRGHRYADDPGSPRRDLAPAPGDTGSYAPPEPRAQRRARDESASFGAGPMPAPPTSAQRSAVPMPARPPASAPRSAVPMPTQPPASAQPSAVPMPSQPPTPAQRSAVPMPARPPASAPRGDVRMPAQPPTSAQRSAVPLPPPASATPGAPPKGRAKYNGNGGDWREQTGSWESEPDTSSWVRDPDTGQWSRSEDDPRILAWRREAERREAMGEGPRALPAPPPAAQEPEPPTTGWRNSSPAPLPPGPAPRSAMPYGDATSPTSSAPGRAPYEQPREYGYGAERDPYDAPGAAPTSSMPGYDAPRGYGSAPTSAIPGRDPYDAPPRGYSAAPASSVPYDRPRDYGTAPTDTAAPRAPYDYGSAPTNTAAPRDTYDPPRDYGSGPTSSAPGRDPYDYGSGPTRSLPDRDPYGPPRGYSGAPRDPYDTPNGYGVAPADQPREFRSPAPGRGYRDDEPRSGPAAPYSGQRALPSAPRSAPSYGGPASGVPGGPIGYSASAPVSAPRHAPGYSGPGSAPVGSTPAGTSGYPGAAPSSGIPQYIPLEEPRRSGRRRAEDDTQIRRNAADPATYAEPPVPGAWQPGPDPRPNRPGRPSGPDDVPPWSSGDPTEIPPEPEPSAWHLDERRERARGSATYRDGGGGDWRRDLADQSDLAEGESRRFGTSDYVPFRSSGSAAVTGQSNLSTTSTSLISPVPRETPANPGAPVPSRRAAANWNGPSGAYERRPVTGGYPPGRKSDLLDPDDEEDEQGSGSPLAAVGYTVIWYGVPVVLFVIYMFVVGTGEQGHALGTLAKAAPQFLISLVLSVLVAIGLRFVSHSWKAISVGLAAAVVGGGLATVLTSAITGNSLS